MNIPGEPATNEQETGPRWSGLWARVRYWVLVWAQIFEPDEIRRDGLSRRMALRCRDWLWRLEASVRRLIIAAGLAFDLSKLAAGKVRGQNRPAAEDGRQIRPPPIRTASFRVVSFRGCGPAATIKAPALHAASSERHLPIPGDSLLALGSARRSPVGGATALRPPHPLLGRNGVITWDDYLRQDEADRANSISLLCKSQPSGDEPEAGAEAGRDREKLSPARALPSARPCGHALEEEWRRIESEWLRVLPARGLAARISALVAAMNEPERHVARFARRLLLQPQLAGLLRHQSEPVLGKPKYDRSGPQVDEDLVPLAHANMVMARPDTS